MAVLGSIDWRHSGKTLTRYAPDDAGFIGQHRRRHDGQRGVFAAADDYLAGQRRAAFNQKAFHIRLKLNRYYVQRITA
ncbi:MAG TPA: hypothetical protein VME24_03975 [Alphaproteobacteria bacterium]|nr:hypothetical protein [Alphaproteobacteria bacterium]